MYQDYELYGVFRASYAQLDKPTQYKGKGVAKYRIALLIPKSDKALVKAIKKAIKASADSQFPGESFVSPLHDGDDPKKDGQAEYKNHYYLNASNRMEVQTIDGQKRPIPPSDIYSGCYVNATLYFYPYEAGDNGVGVSVSGVQKVRDGEKLGGGNPDTTDKFPVVEVTDTSDEDYDDDDDLIN